MEAINGRRHKSSDYVVVRGEQVGRALKLLCTRKINDLILACRNCPVCDRQIGINPRH